MSSWTALAGEVAHAVEAEQEWRRRQGERRRREAEVDLSAYRDDPVGFCRDVLGVTLTAKQATILDALIDHPHQVMVRSANNVGKSFLSAAAALWFYMTRDPAAVILTAPTFRQVVRVTFKEVRRLYGTRPGIMPRAPHIETSPFHVLTGFTAVDENSFQGLRERSNLIVFEECIGIDPDIWTGAQGILSGGDDSIWLAIHNPTDSATQAYLEEQSGTWAVFSISAFEHPNIAAELADEEPPIPAAVRLGRLLVNMRSWGEFIPATLAELTDVDLEDPATYGLDALAGPAIDGIRSHFPERYWRPTTPEGDARILGRYPRQSAYSLFGEAMFDLADRLVLRDPWDVNTRPTIGCDVARFGDDYTAIHVRRGRESLHHESFRGHDTEHTAGRLKELARRFADECGCKPEEIRVHIDDTGVGGGVVDQKGTFRFLPVNASNSPRDEERYPNVRSEVLFDLSEQMREGRVMLRTIPVATRQELRRQAVGITYRLDSAGRRVAEPKEKIKERLRRSPDDLDAVALAYYEPPAMGFAGPPVKVELERKDPYRREDRPRRFGR